MIKSGSAYFTEACSWGSALPSLEPSGAHDVVLVPQNVRVDDLLTSETRTASNLRLSKACATTNPHLNSHGQGILANVSLLLPGPRRGGTAQ